LRVAVIDMGSNSTRLLVADVERAGEELVEVERHSRVTRLGRGVDTAGQLASEAIDDVCTVVSDYLAIAAGHGCRDTVALATSAVRDAANGDAFLAELRERFALPARTIDGSEEARLSWAGAGAGRPASGRRLVFDIGGGSTELILGSGPVPDFHSSLQVGVVRHSERFLSSDPPAPDQLEALADAVRDTLTQARAAAGPAPADAIAVAGTPTSLAAIELALEPYDGAAVEGHVLELEPVQHQLSRLAAVPLAERREIVGLHPDRAPTIVAGTVILIAVMRAFGLDRVTVSEHDILWGAALAAADAAGPEPRS
jgi:exopolyphosphatase/guanosine-5'-triphosphate,3'-diphosphate pyrophosphatase